MKATIECECGGELSIRVTGENRSWDSYRGKARLWSAKACDGCNREYEVHAFVEEED